MNVRQQTKRIPHPQYIVLGVVLIAAGIAVSVFYPHLTIAHIPQWMSSNIATEIKCLGIGFVVGGAIGRRPKLAQAN